MGDDAKSEQAPEDVRDEIELEDQEGELLPEREVMSLLPIGDPGLPVKVLPPH